MKRNSLNLVVFLSIAFLLSSCSSFLHKSTFIVSGTYLEVTSSSRRAAKIVHQEFKRLDAIFNNYDPDSEISILNNTYNVEVKASREMIEILQLAKQAYAISNGALDVSQGALYGFWKGLIKKGNIKELPSEAEIARLKKLGDTNYIEINSDKSTVLIMKEGLKIDLGSIAKGYMVDKAVLKLREAGISSAIINAGGDIYCLGLNKNRPWRIGIKNPEDLGGIIENEDLVDEAIATSGNYEQFFEFGGERLSHIIDPKSGYPVKNNISSVTVISKNCTTADSLATGFFVMGLEGIGNFLSRNPSTMRIFVITQGKDGKNIHFFK